MSDFTRPQYIEIGDGRVIGWTISGPPDNVRRRRVVAVWVESGPPLTPEEEARVSAAIVAELVGCGCEVYSWGTVEMEEPP